MRERGEQKNCQHFFFPVGCAVHRARARGRTNLKSHILSTLRHIFHQDLMSQKSTAHMPHNIGPRTKIEQFAIHGSLAQTRSKGRLSKEDWDALRKASLDFCCSLERTELVNQCNREGVSLVSARKPCHPTHGTLLLVSRRLQRSHMGVECSLYNKERKHTNKPLSL